MSKRFMILALALALTLAAVTAQAQMLTKKQFSADNYTRDADGTEETYKVYMGGDRMRVDQPGGAMIIRMDLNVMWMIDDDEKVYMESVVNPDDVDMTVAQDIADGQDVTKLGTETVNGYHCTKYRVVTHMGDMMGQMPDLSNMPPEIRAEIEQAMGGMSGDVVSTVWESEDLGVAMRSQDEDGSLEELRNVQEGTQPASLFEPPAGYQKRQMSFGSMPQ